MRTAQHTRPVAATARVHGEVQRRVRSAEARAVDGADGGRVLLRDAADAVRGGGRTRRGVGLAAVAHIAIAVAEARAALSVGARAADAEHGRDVDDGGAAVRPTATTMERVIGGVGGAAETRYGIAVRKGRRA